MVVAVDVTRDEIGEPSTACQSALEADGTVMVVIKCERCRRPFGSYAKRCPDCGWRSRYWVRSFCIRFVSIVGALVALVTTYKIAHRQLQIEHANPKVKPTEDQIEPPWKR